MIERFDEVEQRLTDIEVALRGDLKGSPGILQNLVKLMNDIYIPPDGVMQKVARLEDWQIRKEERAKGAIWVLRGAWAVIFFGIGILVNHFFK
jgi:hypothetical protein